MGALKALFCGILLIIFMIPFWSVISVEFITPRLGQVHFGDADNSCQRSFSTVWHTMLFFFQTLVVGDDWGTCINPMVSNMPATLINKMVDVAATPSTKSVHATQVHVTKTAK